jgi:serine/threonine protein kinase
MSPRSNDTTSPRSASGPELGQTLGGYRLLSVLGEGGMGVVYKAEDLALGRVVALKRIRPRLARDRSFLRRFRTEARALARIQSASIVGIHALRDVDGGLLIDMEFVDGGTLKERIVETGALPWAAALPIMQDILRAFDDAHSAGVIHRDVKPQNVMLPRSGGVKVTDFGLARLHSDGDETVTRGVAGTLKYMSPEQVRGSADLDARSDLFSLGLLFFEMLTGQLPFDEDASDFDIMRTIADTDLPTPRSVRPDLPQELDQIIGRLLQHDPDRRYASAGETLRDLEAFARRHPSAPTTDDAEPDAPSSTSASASSPRWTLIGGGIGGVVLALVAAWLWPTAPDAATLTLRTTPAGASVYVDGRFVGTTPLDEAAVDAGARQVRVERAGFVAVDTGLALEASGATLALLSVASRPSGAQVYVDGTLLGTTPLDTAQIGLDAQRVRLERSGYRPYEAMLRDVAAGSVADLGTVALEAVSPPSTSSPEPDAPPRDEPRPQPAAPQASLQLQVVPSGEAILDGTPVSGARPATVPAGRQRVQIRHPEYGVFEAPVTLAPGSETALVYHLEQPVTINTLGPWGNVWINGENQGNTPLSTRLTPGTHRIELRIERSDVFTITGGTHTQRIGDDAGGSEAFSGAVVTLEVRPGFQETRHTVSFNVRR